jgi:hypothetical protein
VQAQAAQTSYPSAAQMQGYSGQTAQATQAAQNAQALQYAQYQQQQQQQLQQQQHGRPSVEAFNANAPRVPPEMAPPAAGNHGNGEHLHGHHHHPQQQHYFQPQFAPQQPPHVHGQPQFYPQHDHNRFYGPPQPVQHNRQPPPHPQHPPDPAGMLPRPPSSRERVPRPHSADFLEYERQFGPLEGQDAGPGNGGVPYRGQSRHPNRQQPPRPKSSIDQRIPSEVRRQMLEQQNHESGFQRTAPPPSSSNPARHVNNVSGVNGVSYAQQQLQQLHLDGRTTTPVAPRTPSLPRHLDTSTPNYRDRTPQKLAYNVSSFGL